MNRLIDTTFNGVNITSAAEVYHYHATKTCNLRIQLFLSNAAGGGDYVVYLTKQLAGAGSVYVMLPKTTATAGAGETTLCFQTINVDVDNTDIISIMIDGLAGDVAVNGTVRIWEDDYLRPTTAAQYNVDVTATGAVGIDWANVEAPTTALNLSGTTIKTATDVETDTGNIQGRLPAALVGGRIDASVGAIANNAITAAAITDGAITNAKVADDVNVNAKTISANAITAAAIMDGAITNAKVADDVDVNTKTISPNATTAIDAALAAMHGAGAWGGPTTAQINAALSAVHGAGPWGGAAGSGAITFTYTLTNAITHLPIADADVWVTSDAAGANTLASGRTNQFGRVVFYLDAGTVYVWRQKSGWDFTNPDTEVVT